MVLAVAEDIKVKKILSDARLRRGGQTVSQIKKDATAFMTRMDRASQRSIRALVQSKALLEMNEFLTSIGGNRQWVSYALRTGRIFKVRAPSGIDYIPSFFAVPLEGRRVLGKVARLLSALPDESQYHFFVTKRRTLGGTPLEALAQGRIRAVLVTALGFVGN